MDIKEIIDFNLQQYDHVAIHQKMVLNYVTDIIKDTLMHDRTKLTEKEYLAFVSSRASLNSSKDGKDAEYQKNLNSEAILNQLRKDCPDRVG